MKKIIFYLLIFCTLTLNSLTLQAAPPSTIKFKCSEPKESNLAIDYLGTDLGDELATSFAEGDFKSIIDAAHLWKEKRCLLSDGDTRISFWLSGFTKYFIKKNDWQKSLEQIKKFQQAYPKSTLPLLAESRYWSDYANNARGFGYASTVSDEGWKLFKSRLRMSEKTLLKIEETGANWPQWYWQMIRVQSLLGASKKTRHHYFLEGIKKFKNEYAIYTEMAYYLEPRWGGSWKEVDEIISIAVKKITVEPPEATYARMYMARGELISPRQNLFKNSQIDWTKMRRGLITLMNLFPESTLIQNNLLSYSCIVGDKPTYIKYRQKLKTTDNRAWYYVPEVGQCDQIYGFNK